MTLRYIDADRVLESSAHAVPNHSQNLARVLADMQVNLIAQNMAMGAEVQLLPITAARTPRADKLVTPHASRRRAVGRFRRDISLALTVREDALRGRPP